MQRRSNEIEEEKEEEEEEEEDGRRGLETVRESQLEGRSSGTVSMNGEDNVYVGVGKGDSSMEALRWAIDNLITSSSTLLFLIHVFPETRFIPYPLGRLTREKADPCSGEADSSMEALRWAIDNLITSSSTLLFLIHVFPETRFIPYPLGRLTREKAIQEQVESFMSQEREKRRTLLLKFLHACSASKVKVETILVESDSVAKAIQDLITILNIKKLVLGIDKSNARKATSVKGNSVPEQIMRSSAADMCEVKVICQGKEIKMEVAMMENSPSKSPIVHRPKKDQPVDPFACICFISKPKTNR